MDVFELARRYHEELGIKEPGFATLSAEIFGELGLDIVAHLKETGYTLKATRFVDYEKSLILEVIKEDKAFEILLRKL
ncbi:hypothetical protein PAP_09090 [Palaeococcus pacificus DY20341]|uniref:Uncharacterized protein n=1 Tax=Palaeococcus pacificus DY20341 TaxID=1343739 RepID=A0A075M073_9EURY|nr:hypothetical protein [Palaeococcus pacificus]AIF70198.1 hypothetical protein PAP_09090 [Palaeococcus pacificus DY20341]